jgi:nitrite reductase (NADH) small subunit
VAEFVTVADLSELKPGECKTVEADGRAIAIFNVAGVVYALENVCLHQGGPLGDGDLDGNVVTCPWHGWQYNAHCHFPRQNRRRRDHGGRVARRILGLQDAVTTNLDSLFGGMPWRTARFE